MCFAVANLQPPRLLHKCNEQHCTVSLPVCSVPQHILFTAAVMCTCVWLQLHTQTGIPDLNKLPTELGSTARTQHVSYHHCALCAHVQIYMRFGVGDCGHGLVRNELVGNGVVRVAGCKHLYMPICRMQEA